MRYGCHAPVATALLSDSRHDPVSIHERRGDASVRRAVPLVALALALGAGVGLAAASAQAAPVAIVDDAPVTGPDHSFTQRWNSGAGGGSARSGGSEWVDTIGASHGFETLRIAVEWLGNDVKVTTFTNYLQGGKTIGGQFIGLADWAFDLDGDGSFEVGFALDDATGTSGTLKTVSDWDTSREIFTMGGFIYGGGTAVCDGTAADCTANVRAPETRVNTGSGYLTASGNPVTSTIADLGAGSIGAHAYQHAYVFTLAGVAESTLAWNDFTVFWGTGWCANDSIEGHVTRPVDPGGETPVPVPAALPLLLSAITGLAVVGYRRRPEAGHRTSG